MVSRVVYLLALAAALLMAALPPDECDAQDADPPTAQVPQRLVDPPAGFDDSAFRIDSWAGWRILNARDSREPDALVAGIGSWFRFSQWEGSVAFEIAIREGRPALRADDYNELSDYFHIIRRLQYGRKGEGKFFFRLGELTGTSGTIGHGTIVDAYQSVADYNSRAIGMQIDLDFDTFGVETLVNSFTAWNTSAARVWLRPLRFAAEPHPVLKNLALGLTIAGDLNAPGRLITSGGRVSLDEKRNINFNARSVGIIGADIDIPLVDLETFRLAGWVDFAQIVDFGNGWFVGVRASFDLPLWDTLPLEVSAEWQQLSRAFIPSYFDAFYEIERYAFPKLDSATTRIQYLPQATPTPGFRIGLSWGVKRLVQFRGSFADYMTDRNNQLGRLMLELGTPPDAPLPFGIHITWIKRGVASWSDAFALDDRAMLRLTATLGFGDEFPLRLGLTVERSWRIQQQTGRYESLDNWFPWLGIGLGF